MPAPLWAESQTRSIRPCGVHLEMRGFAGAIDLVVDSDLRHFVRFDRCQHFVDLRDAIGPLRVRGIDHVQQQVRLARFLQRRAERRDQFVRQVAHETDSIGQRRFEPGRQVQPAHGRVERREQLVGGVRIGRASGG